MNIKYCACFKINSFDVIKSLYFRGFMQKVKIVKLPIDEVLADAETLPDAELLPGPEALPDARRRKSWLKCFKYFIHHL